MTERRDRMGPVGAGPRPVSDRQPRSGPPAQGGLRPGERPAMRPAARSASTSSAGPSARPAARRPAGARPSGARDGRPVRRPRPLPVLLGLPVLGALLDELLGAPLGWVFGIATVLASAWAALLASPRGLWWVLPAPPLLVLGVTALTQPLLHGASLQGAGLATTLLKWAVGGFPVMAWAVLAALAALGLRRLLNRGPARRHDHQVPVPRRSTHG